MKIKVINLRHVLIEVHIDIVQNNKRGRWREGTNEDGWKENENRIKLPDIYRERSI